MTKSLMCESTTAPPSASPTGVTPPLIDMRGIKKSFSGVKVLRDVDFKLTAGEVHILAGENGAGKSTLVKILSGVYSDYQGSIRLSGQAVRFYTPSQAARHGVVMIHQEMSLIPSMSVMDNIFLGREITRGGPWIDCSRQSARARDILKEVGLDIELFRPVAEFPTAVQQMVEIAKALTFDARVLIMDEPTSALSEPEVDRLFRIIGKLKERGAAIVFISHRMDEIYRIGDRITVLRDGSQIGTARVPELPRDKLIQWMVGRELDQQFPQRTKHTGTTRLSVENLSIPDAGGAQPWSVHDVSFSVSAGEILGVAGLQGSGSTELFRGLFGASESRPLGKISVDGRPVDIRRPRDAIDHGLAWLTNNRRRDGLLLDMSLTHNITRASLGAFSPWGWLLPRRERAVAETFRRDLDIRSTSAEQPVGELSGGNQQKVVFASWLGTRPKVFLLDEPTRGIDVATKYQIYELMNQWSTQGMAILLITSEMPELLAMSDRILVMHRGRMAGVFDARRTSQEEILRAAMGEPSS